MNLDKLRDVHDFAVENGATCGPQCAIFHKAATPTGSKNHTVERARALTFLLDLGQHIN
jgi:hypothetical protein